MIKPWLCRFRFIPRILRNKIMVHSLDTLIDGYHYQKVGLWFCSLGDFVLFRWSDLICGILREKYRCVGQKPHISRRSAIPVGHSPHSCPYPQTTTGRADQAPYSPPGLISVFSVVGFGCKTRFSLLQNCWTSCCSLADKNLLFSF